ncbi:pyridoxamine 5'-phosphate oxidase family protein [Hathewaya massiliensis]|uniref:pyridoxamine 5'-phosphate oxidase family protein n=1 Tax=Hathewaya massiliensis TaxID=1964382 RepID=UPI00115C0551|nr:pyridoxamine 5'-phosphate oxidase family protein [Hathewaya massiliensis]
MFKELRNSKRQLQDHDLERILNEGEYGVLATIGENQYPYSTPLSYVYINNSLYFHGASEGHKLKNIKLNEKVSFSVVQGTEILQERFTTKYESVIIFGKASTVVDEEEKRTALMAFIDKYSPDFKKEGVEYINRAASKTNIVKITIDHATAKGNR